MGTRKNKLQALIGANKNCYIQSKLRLLTCWQQAVGKSDCVEDDSSRLNKYYYLDENKNRIYNNGTDRWFWKYVSIESRKSRNSVDIALGISLLALGIIVGRLISIIV